MLRTKQIKRIKTGSYRVVRRDGSGLGYITKLARAWEVKLDGADNCGIQPLHDSFDACQSALIQGRICAPKGA